MKIEELVSLKKKIELSENILTEYVGSKPKDTYQKVAAFKYHEPEPTQHAKLKVKPPEKSLGPGVHGPLPPVLVTRRKKIYKIVFRMVARYRLYSVAIKLEKFTDLNGIQTQGKQLDQMSLLRLNHLVG